MPNAIIDLSNATWIDIALLAMAGIGCLLTFFVFVYSVYDYRKREKMLEELDKLHREKR
jgi:uncharacterized integral membrane protein